MSEHVVPPRPARDAWMIAGLVVLAVILVAAIGVAAPDRFGASQDGVNGAMWGSQAIALRGDGPIESKFGAEFFGLTYANHPPAIAIQAALTQLVGGDGPIATRAPAWLGSIAALLALWHVGRRLGMDRRAVAWGLVIAASSPLFFDYVAMLDTPVTSLPFGAVLLVAWLGADGPRRLTLIALAAFAAAASGWEALLFAGVLGLVGIAGGQRRRGAASIAGAAAGAAAVVAWQLWVYGSLANLREQLRNRATLSTYGETFDVGLFEAYDRQLTWFLQLVNPVALLAGLAGIGLLVRDGGNRRTVALATLGTVVLYDAALPGGVAFHPYWSYWSVLPFALGAARSVSWLADAAPRLPLVARAATLIGVLAPLLLLQSTFVRDEREQGLALVTLVERSPVPPDGVAGMNEIGLAGWYEHGRTGAPPSGTCDRDRPGGCVLVVELELLAERLDPAVFEALDLLEVEGPFALVSSDELPSSP